MFFCFAYSNIRLISEPTNIISFIFNYLYVTNLLHYMKLNTGQLNQNIGIYQQVNTDDGYGNSTSTDVLYWQTVASVTPMKANRTLQANQEIVKSAFTFTVRYRNDKFLQEGMTVLYRGDRFTITSAEVDPVYREHVSIIGKANELPQR